MRTHVILYVYVIDWASAGRAGQGAGQGGAGAGREVGQQ